MAETFDVAVIGAGLVGLATARALRQSRPRSIVLLEAEDRPAKHQSGHNSGVLHSGLYYRPGSLKATLCARGRRLLEEYCSERSVPFERCGKLVVAVDTSESAALDRLEERGRQNGVTGVLRVGPEAIAEREPHVRGVDGLLVPETGIVDFRAVAERLRDDLERDGVAVRLDHRVRAIAAESTGFTVGTDGGEVHCRALINCAGLQADRVARLTGVTPGVRIVPFRGEYKLLRPERSNLVRHLVYPVPDPRFPFLGVHFTRRIDGTVEAGPNAVLATHRHGYRRRDVSLGDVASMLTWGGFWRMARQHWRTGLGEWRRSLSHRAFTGALQRLIPELQPADLRPGGSGVRAQAIDRSGAIADDFCLARGPRSLHVLSAPSPAATACLAIGEHLAGIADPQFAG